MQLPPNFSPAFRRSLKQEVPLWRERGLVDAAQAEALAQLYRLDELPQTRFSLVTAVALCGALLIGLGVISFVAANWQALPTLARILLLLGAMWGAYGGGFYLWRVRGQSAAGQALVLVGSLVYGANIGLFGQIFHLQGELYQALLLWVVGALLVAFALPNLANALLALLVGCSACLSASFSQGQIDQPLWWLLPWSGLALFLLLAWRERSWLLYQISGLAFSLVVLLQGVDRFGFGDGPPFVFGLLVAAWLWVFATLPAAAGVPQGRFARGVAFFAVALVGYYYSFWFALEPLPGRWEMASDSSSWLLLTSLIAGGGWLLWQSNDLQLRLQALAIAVGAAGVLLPLLLGLPDLAAIIWRNLTLLAMGSYLLWAGLHAGDRRAFLLGTGFWGLLILSRFFEYETGLLIKSAAFVGIGLAVVAAAFWFEKFLQREEGFKNA
ncbi:DUF2157 domain-containing protein [Gloeobacter kilaueensis]|uniref:DUF2157 domain-containing protein n=1 Tax=Gloeobacter kilaueensis (strain ATCC BAA-2537 / CCAP 1431/1 / ULC 316 / JS1) TaxID=1183438 RepID=U5QLB8_GLOK1|nr:DUF2157 domain-containing protein [Gloeobacter kilaueensis]AGY58379.1 hypothetical protein GKIL_2133 [Gloeobacter kilaueensis JS1]